MDGKGIPGQEAKTAGGRNFLYVDGHVETKTVYETLDPVFEWGDQLYSLKPGNDILK